MKNKNKSEQAKIEGNIYKHFTLTIRHVGLTVPACLCLFLWLCTGHVYNF